MRTATFDTIGVAAISRWTADEGQPTWKSVIQILPAHQPSQVRARQSARQPVWREAIGCKAGDEAGHRDAMSARNPLPQ